MQHFKHHLSQQGWLCDEQGWLCDECQLTECAECGEEFKALNEGDWLCNECIDKLEMEQTIEKHT
jgi:hypothetical protein